MHSIMFFFYLETARVSYDLQGNSPILNGNVEGSLKSVGLSYEHHTVFNKWWVSELERWPCFKWFTKSVNSTFRAFWLAPAVTRNVLISTMSTGCKPFCYDVMVRTTPTSFPGFSLSLSLRLRLVLWKCVSINCAAGVSPQLNFCRLDDEILSGVGGKNLTSLLAACDNIILRAKQVICLESVYK